MSIWSGLRRWAALAVALALLNVSLAFQNLWPTPAVTATRALSIEAALIVLIIVLWRSWRGALSRQALRILTTVWIVLVIGRYADVTAQGLFGRQINLYWDLRLMPAVGSMLSTVANPLLVIAILVAAVLIPLLLYVVIRWAFGRVNRAAEEPLARRVMVVMTLGVVLLFPIQHVEEPIAELPRVSEPVTTTFGHQARLFFQEATGIGIPPLAPAPSIDSSLGRLDGADVFLIFMESYGAVAWDQGRFAKGLTSSLARFEASVHETGRDIVSGFVVSPTFGGGSWLAHVNVLSGTEIRDENANVRLMAQKRNTLVTAFTRRGYRTVAIMPGLKQSWPEGTFYGFDEIYGTDRLRYRGPPFGWWYLTDQFAIARMDDLVVAPRDRSPLLVFFPTISTHTPFVPTPPYQADWPRMLTDEPYGEKELQKAWSEQPDWEDLGPAYVKSLAYAFDTIGGYLRYRADRNFVVVLIGDHQPPALITGQGATWEVPVHVIAGSSEILERLRQQGFQAGLHPRRPSLGPMHTLMPRLLDAFDDQE